MSTPEMVFFFLSGTLFLMMFIWLGVSLHLAYTKLDVIREHLRNSPSVRRLDLYRHLGPWGKLMFINGIAGYMTFPRRYINKGAIRTEDIEGFPAPLKRKLVIMHRSSLVLSSLMFLMFGIGKAVGWIG